MGWLAGGPAKMAATNKCLAQNNKSHVSRATKDEAALATGRMFHVGVKAEAWAAKVRYVMKRHMDSMGNNCLNISVLFEPYTERCKRLVANPDAVLKEFLR
jgi:hypothetical protein